MTTCMPPTLPILKPISLELQRAALREKNAQALAGHQINKARAEQCHDVDGVRVATLGILRCNGIAALLER